MAKVKYFCKSECDEIEKSLFVASNGWVNNFMGQNGFSVRCKTTTAQQDSERLIMYILHTPRLSVKYKHSPSSITVMNETSIWNDMASNTTIDKQGARSVCLKTTGYVKCMVSVCLATKAGGIKMKPFVVFHAAKRESKSLYDGLKSRFVVKSSGNAWMKEEVTTVWVKRVLGALSFNRRLLAWTPTNAI